MFRIVDGIAFEGKQSDSRFQVTVTDFLNGHREVVVQKAVDWQERGPVHPEAQPATEEELLERREANERRACRRATKVIRHRAKSQSLDTLLTLTYRANQTDRALCRLHLKLFLERMRALYRRLGLEFVYVGCFEQQARGAWHVHLGVQRIPRVLPGVDGVLVKSWNVIRAVWRRVVGEYGGNIDAGRWKFTAKKSPAKCAAYISKYVGKAFAEGEDYSKRYVWSKCEPPERTSFEVDGDELARLIAGAVEFCCESGRVLASSWFSRFGDVYYCAGESPPATRAGG